MIDVILVLTEYIWVSSLMSDGKRILVPKENAANIFESVSFDGILQAGNDAQT